MENGRLAQISVFVALFITLASLCVTVKLHTDIENNLDLLNYGISQEAEKEGVKIYTAKSATKEVNTEISIIAEESLTQTENTVTDNQTNAYKNSSVNTANGIAASGSRENGQKQTQNSVQTTAKPKTTAPPVTEKVTVLDSVFVYSKNSKKLHSRTCPYGAKIKEENRMTITSDELQKYLDNGYEFCASCQGFTTVE